MRPRMIKLFSRLRKAKPLKDTIVGTTIGGLPRERATGNEPVDVELLGMRTADQILKSIKAKKEEKERKKERKKKEQEEVEKSHQRQAESRVYERMSTLISEISSNIPNPNREPNRRVLHSRNQKEQHPSDKKIPFLKNAKPSYRKSTKAARREDNIQFMNNAPKPEPKKEEPKKGFFERLKDFLKRRYGNN